MKEIKENDLNLNVIRYLNTTEPIEVMSAEDTLVQFQQAERKLDEAVAKMNSLLAELGFAD